jgi:RNA polymerase sigma-70 factor (ECF subfamily)
VVALMAGVGQDALVGMIERAIRPSFRLARAVLLDDREAEDAVQDACIRAWRSRSSLRDPKLFRPWFDRILINVCRDQIRARRRQRVRAIALQHAFTDQTAARGDVERGIDDALDALDPEHRLVVVLRYWEDLELEDISSRCGIPTGTVKSRLHYAIKTMRQRLETTDGRA